MAAHRGLSVEYVDALETLQVGDGFSGHVVASGEPLVVPNTHGDPRVPAAIQGPFMFGSVASVPLVSSSKVLGALVVSSEAMRSFDPGEVELLRSIGQQIGVAVQNSRLLARAGEVAALEERQRLARELHDAVTQTLFSAGLIAEVLPRLWERNPEEARRRTEEMRQLARGALAEMRTLLMELRPSAMAEARLSDLLRQLSRGFHGQGEGAGGAGHRRRRMRAAA